MDLDRNVTYFKLDGFVQVKKFRYLYFVLMLFIFILILCSNFLIMFLIVTQKSLHEPMYVFIAALSLNSVIFSFVIYPKLLIDFLSERQIVSHSACHFQWLMFYSIGGSEFLLLAAMAYDRHVSICKPLQYPLIMNNTTVRILLFSAWLLPAVHVAGPIVMNSLRKPCRLIVKGIFCNNTALNLHCQLLKYEPYYSMIVVFNILILPVVFILFTYARIFIVTYRSSRDVKKKAAQTCLPHLAVLICFSCLCFYDAIVLFFGTNFSKDVNFAMTFQILIHQPLFNPIIYGLKMKEISKHIKRLLCRMKIN